MLEIMRRLVVMAVVLQSSVASNLNQTAVQSPPENTTMVPLNDGEVFEKNDNLSIAEPRLFPIGHPDFIPSAANLISPFDMQTFGRQLLPLINVNIKEKVKDFARTFNDGADMIEDAIRDGWRDSPLNPHNYKYVLDGPTNIMHKYILPLTPLGAANSLRKPAGKAPTVVKASPPAKAPPKHKEKAPRGVQQTQSEDSMVHDYGIDDFKHFEKSILRELERQEELKVEATLHTLYGHGQDVEIVHGKPHSEKSGWKPVAAPTKIYDELSDTHSQIVSPLHTSIFGSGKTGNSDSQHFHDFDENLNGNSITHSTYSVHDDDDGEEVESKIKPVKAKITVVTRKATPAPIPAITVSFTTGKSRYRKRHNSNAVKTPVALDSVPDSGFGESQVVTKFKRNPQRQHIQSFTTSKPGRTYSTSTMHHVPSVWPFTTDPPKQDYTPQETSIGLVHREAPSRFRFSSTIPTTVKPSRTVVREASKFIDKPKVTGFRGSVKFGQSTTKSPVY